MRIALLVFAAFAACVASSASAFLQPGLPQRHGMAVCRMTPEEQRAQALASYLSKAHQEKLNAIQELERKKSEEIASLMEQLEDLRRSAGKPPPPVVPTTASVDFGTEDLAKKLADAAEKLAQFQKQAEEDKAKAVKDAEVALKEKYEAELAALKGGKPAQATEATSAVDGSMVNGAGAESARPSSPAPPDIAAADHGMRADGGIGGLTLAERIALGAKAAATEAETPAPEAAPAAAAAPSGEVVEGGHSLFDQRNAHVVAAAQAGKSRWGSMEIEKARNAAGVAQPAAAPAKATATSKSLYEQRNAQVAAAAKAGKSRWGSEESERAQKLAV